MKKAFLATLALASLIIIGSRNLAHFDAALVGYTFAVLFAAPVAWADGPMPYASQGGSGVLMPDGLTRLVAVGVGAAGLPQ